MHFDTMSGLTTAGTPQDMDSRYHRVFRRMRADYSWAIRECVKVLPTRVMVVPGNHDQLAAFHLGEVLAAEFDDHAFVSIDNDPKLRKYVEWGTVLLGFTHGRFENIRNLPGIMATEMREAWGRTSVHEFHIGHWHTKRQREWKSIEECDGAVVRTLPALTGPDHWHYTHGFITSRQACECYIWDRKDGYVGHFSWNVPLEESVK